MTNVFNPEWEPRSQELGLYQVRHKRDELLAQSDWVVTMHKEKGTNIPAAWKTYRQALRDITDGLTVPFNKYDYVDMDAIDWPEKPE